MPSKIKQRLPYTVFDVFVQCQQRLGQFSHAVFLAPSYLGALPKHRHQRGPRYGTKSSGTVEFYGFIVPDTT